MIPAGKSQLEEYRTAIDDYVRDEVLPYVPDAWVDYAKTKIGYEIPLTRHFYKYVPPQPFLAHSNSDTPWPNQSPRGLPKS